MTAASVEITITAASEGWTYDGSAHSNNAVSVTSGSLLEGDELVATATGSVTNVADTADGNNPIAAGYKIMHGEEDVTESYEITPVAGTLTINPKDVTITAQDKEFTYNGTAQSWAEYDVEGLVGNDAITAVVTGSITFPSESPATNELTSYEFTTGTPGNYSVTTANGELTMTAASVEITITAASEGWTYDGSAHSNNAVSVTSGSLLEGDELVATATGSVTNVADTADGNNPIAEGYKIMHGDEDVTANYTITPVAGKLTINPISAVVTITGHTVNTVFDGDEHTASGYDVETSNPLYTEADFAFSGDATAARRDAGTTDMGLAGDQFTNTNPNFTNVTFTVEDGYITITRKPVTVSANSQNKTYGEADQPLTAEVTGTVGSDTVDYTLTREEGENAGTYTIHVTGTEIQGNYEVSYTDALMTISQVPDVTVTIVGNRNDSAVYNGGTQNVDGYRVEAISHPLYSESDFSFTGTANAAGRDAGTYYMGVTAANFTNLNGNFAHVTFDVDDGYLKISPKDVTVRPDDQGKIYGEPDQDDSWTWTSTPLEGRDVLVPTAITRDAGEDAGEYTMYITVAPDPNYNFILETGVFTIERATATVTADDKTKVFGEEDPDLTATVTGLVNGDGENAISYNALTRTPGEDAGEYTINVSGEAVQGNYNVEYVPGTFTITPEGTVVITIRGYSDELTYDGNEHDLSGYEVVSISDDAYTAADISFIGDTAHFALKGTDAGTYQTALTPDDFMLNSENAASVTFVIEKQGQLNILPRQIILTSATDTKVYDGEPLMNDEIAVTGDGFVKNDGVTVIVTGRITNPGTVENTFTWEFTGGTNENNYRVTEYFGTLTVTPTTTHRLHITYVDENGRQISVFDKEYATGETYDVITPTLKGYEADRERVTGRMGDEDIYITVTYRPITYALIIRYESATTGDEISASTTLRLKAGEEYAVQVPALEGYTSLVPIVTGTMPASDRQITILYLEDTAEPGTTIVPILIEDYGTPLGIPNSVLGSGEVIE